VGLASKLVAERLVEPTNHRHEAQPPPVSGGVGCGEAVLNPDVGDCVGVGVGPCLMPSAPETPAEALLTGDNGVAAGERASSLRAVMPPRSSHSAWPAQPRNPIAVEVRRIVSGCDHETLEGPESVRFSLPIAADDPACRLFKALPSKRTEANNNTRTAQVGLVRFQHSTLSKTSAPEHSSNFVFNSKPVRSVQCPSLFRSGKKMARRRG
jgi:hypothetical protein